MKEYEIVAKFCNTCTGDSGQQTFFEETELASTADFVRMKHSNDFIKFRKFFLMAISCMYIITEVRATVTSSPNFIRKVVKCQFELAKI